MECLEAKALKSSLHWELAMKAATQQEILEEVLCFNGANVVSGEDFEVDEFFNFSNGDSGHGSALQTEENDDDDEFETNPAVEDDDSSNSNQSGDFPAVDDSESLLSGGLSVPGDSLEDLEWVSQFVDDSCSEFSFSWPVVKTEVESQTSAGNRSEPGTQLAGAGYSCFLSSFPARPRTKRSRKSRQPKSVGSNQSPASSSSSTTSSGISSAPSLIFTDAGENFDSFNGPSEPPKKQRKTTTQQGGSQFQRRCSHCLVQKTPQWRTGPNGAKTLCNACGVRYKSGRLFPEYRPALSPTFCSEVHSNSHRKVLEMRRMKENEEPASGLSQMVQSY